jgi:hypothetical protein
MKTEPALGAISVGLLACVALGASAAYAGKPPLARNQQSEKASAPSERNKAAAPASGCSLLTPALLEKVLGQPFDHEPAETKMPPAYAGAWGSNCQYHSKKPASQGGVRVEFLVYQESSAAEAKQTFDKAAVFFADPSKGKPSIGDSAYWQRTDSEPSIHVLKGKVHFSLSIDPANQKELTNLAVALASRF